MPTKSATEKAPASQPQPQPKGLPAFALAIAAVVIVGVIAVLAVALGGDGDTTSTKVDEETGQEITINEFQSVEVSGSVLPEFGAGTDPAVGTRAPELSGKAFDSTPVEIKNDGRPKLIVFFAHWCPHCQREIGPLADAIVAGELPEGVDVYAVATATDSAAPNFPPSEWIDREGWTPPVLVDDKDNTAAGAFGLAGFPYFVLVDANGNVVERMSGEQGPEAVAAFMAQASA
jgi:thiol-disulfide isomerase/thioredoxin